MSVYILRNWEAPRRHPHHHHHLQPRFNLDISPEDFLLPLTLAALQNRPQSTARQQTTVAKPEDGSFVMNVDVQHFQPEEITVKVVDRSIVLEAKHEEKQDEHGFISREFTRKYLLPEGFDIDKVCSSMSTDGVLTIKAPKETKESQKERTIPIIHTGPTRQIQTPAQESAANLEKEKEQ